MTDSAKGKVALVTGGGRGIGKAICLELASRGYSVGVNYRSSQKEAEEVVRFIRNAGGTAGAYGGDVSNSEDVAVLCEAVEKELGPISVLVNNAGITKDSPLVRMKNDLWDQVLQTNLNSFFYCIRQVVRSMAKQKWGRIINLSSVVGIMGNAGQANYSAAKAGVIGLTKSVAREYASRGITVNAVAPGFIQTDMTKVLNEKIQEEYLKNIPLGSLGTPEDVARTVAFLASEDARYITGQVLHVDGGMVM
ncbi:MAG TPA: 3-oxoacyl-[acyl-carrier-protein] reductase [Synergistaceae bacterium]|nr:3-oxoacyl-[acyl-carrier-protein] reductase [Synergistaceae bacterium]HPJ25068.1 3-oxoacyl-[acyl-carrier-protein] reductase [Synergistaceae bacterium]